MKRKLIQIIFLFCINIFSSYVAFAADPQITTRTINFVNECPFPIWFGIASGSAENTHPRFPGDTSCASNADCYSGSACTQTGDIKQCFWVNPKPVNGQYQLAAKTGRNSVTIPVFQNKTNITWSGLIVGRTNCSSGRCETADCGAGTGGCPEGRGAEQPATQAEFTLSKTSVDFYNITVINGLNVPLAMSPDFTPIAKCHGPNCNAPYTCGSPGAINPTTETGICQWNFQPPSNDYKWVTAGGAACTADSNCQSPSVCGLSFDPTKNPQFKKSCGKLIGYWTANQVCGINRNYGSPFNCNKALPAPQNNLTLWHLYACVSVPSCYQNGAPNTCCGCVNWDQIGIDVPSSPMTEACKNSNPNWTSGVLNTLAWLKKACPTSYTYPYDDMSSTFTCNRIENGQNNVKYTITYCPGGRTGGMTG